MLKGMSIAPKKGCQISYKLLAKVNIFNRTLFVVCLDLVDWFIDGTIDICMLCIYMQVEKQFWTLEAYLKQYFSEKTRTTNTSSAQLIVKQGKYLADKNIFDLPLIYIIIYFGCIIWLFCSGIMKV